MAFLPEQNAEFVPTRTPTAFKYQFLATETQIPILTPASATAEFRIVPNETSNSTTITTQGTETTPFLVATVQNGNTVQSSSTTQNAGTTADPRIPTATMTPEPILGNAEPLTPGRYDDRNLGFTYIGIWNVEENSYAYQETVVVSEAVGDYVAFRFTGLQLMLGYQSSDDAGEFTVSIDGEEETMNQQVGSIWFSAYLDSGTHYAIITHTGAGPVNLDYIEVAQ